MGYHLKTKPVRDYLHKYCWRKGERAEREGTVIAKAVAVRFFDLGFHAAMDKWTVWEESDRLQGIAYKVPYEMRPPIENLIGGGIR